MLDLASPDFDDWAKSSEKWFTTMLDASAAFSFNVASSHSELRREENTTPVRQNKSYINHEHIIST
jgi:hypothetical protein